MQKKKSGGLVLHLADVVLLGLCVVVWFLSLGQGGPFEGQVVSDGAHLGLALAAAVLACLALRRAVPHARPPLLWLMLLVVFTVALMGAIRVVNAMDDSVATARPTRVASWPLKYVAARGNGKWVQHVIIEGWGPSHQLLTLRVPEGARIERARDFSKQRREQLYQEWRAKLLQQRKTYEKEHFGDLTAWVAELSPGPRLLPEPPLPPFPEPTLGELMFPSDWPCEVLVRPGLLGLEHVVGLRLLL